MNNNHGTHLPAVAVGAAALAAAAAAGIAYAAKATPTSASTTHIRVNKDCHYLVVFLDTPSSGCAKNGTLILHPRDAPFQQLESKVCTALQLCKASLFFYDTKEQLHPSTFQSQLTQHAVSTTSWRNSLVIPLIATDASSGTGLSQQALALSPIRAPPTVLRPLPVIKNAGIMRGPYDPPLYNAWHHLFTPSKVAKWGETVTIVLPNAPQDHVTLKDHVDDPTALRWITTCDPDIVAELLERQEDFPKTWNRAPERALTRLGGNGIFTSGTESLDWQTAHGLFPRGFNQLKITQAYFPIILQKTHKFVDEWSRFPAGHLVTEVNTWLANMTADAVIKASCNVDMDNIARKGRDEPAHPVLQLFRDVGRNSPAVAKPWQIVGLANYLNPFYDTSAGQERIFHQLKGQLEELVGDLVERTRMGEMGATVLSSLINDRSPTTGLYVRQQLLFGQFVNLLVAGHETTANTMGFLMFYLSQNPQWEERIRQEIREVLAGRSEMTATDIPKLVVTEACFREALRLHPPAAQIGRDAAHDTVLKGQYLVRRGQRVQVNLVALHRQERQWGGRFGDPNTFNPERFLPGAAESVGRHPHAYKPFGFGVRSCVGSQFALWEAKTIIPMLYHNFTFKLVGNLKLRPSRKESFPSPSAEGLALYIYPAPGAPGPLSRSANLLPLQQGLGTAAAAANGTAASQLSQPPAAAPSQGSSSGAHRTPLLVLYGSNSGTCEAFAAQVVDAAAAAGFAAAAATLDSKVTSAGRAELPASGAVLIITSTYNGLPPDNAVKFAKWLAAAGPDAAKGVLFAAFGVGNSQWVTYQAFPRLVETQLLAAGGERLMELCSADAEEANFVEAIDDWTARVIPQLLKKFKVALPAGAAAALAACGQPVKPHFTLAAAAPGTPALHIKEVLMKLKSKAAAVTAAELATSGTDKKQQQQFGYDVLKIVAVEQLQASGTGRFTKHVELELPEGMSYSAGDHLEVLPRNSPLLVATALQLLGLTGEEVFNWTPGNQAAARGLNPQAGALQQQQQQSQQLYAASAEAVDTALAAAAGAVAVLPVSPVLPDIGCLPISSHDVLAWLVDLSAVPTKKVLEHLADICPCPPEAFKLKGMASEEQYKQQVSVPKVTLLEVLSSFRSLLSVTDLVSLTASLPRLAPRYYSISSSPAAGTRRATITVALVDFVSASGRQHLGAASSTIHNQKAGLNLGGTVRQLQSTFKLPADPTTPLVMIGPGTGVAPMIGFLEEREALAKAGTKLGPAILFFGCRDDGDFLYKSRLEAWLASGVLTDLQVAFSRKAGQPKSYVQHLIKAEGEQLWHLLNSSPGARVYVCGDAKNMAPDVRATFVQIAEQVGGRSREAADRWLQDMREDAHYLEDVWAS